MHERRAGRKALNYLEWTKRAKVMTDDPTLPFAERESRRGLFIRADSASYKVVGMNVWFEDGGLRNDQTSATDEYNA